MAGGDAKAWPSRPRRSAAERREQKRRAQARVLQAMLRTLTSVNKHRGCQLSKIGKAYAKVLDDEINSSTPCSEGLTAPDPKDVPCTCLVQATLVSTTKTSSANAECVAPSPVETVEFFGHGPVAIDDVPLGQPVRLVNLRTNALNGTHAMLDRYIKESGRFAVILAEGPMAGETKKIKPSNLTDPCDEWLDKFIAEHDIS